MILRLLQVFVVGFAMMIMLSKELESISFISRIAGPETSVPFILGGILIFYGLILVLVSLFKEK